MHTSDGDTPQTFEGLDWSAANVIADSDSPSESPSGTDDAPQTPPASATTSPETPTATTEAGATPQGPIPYDRHKEILEGERKRAADAEAKWQRYQWAEELEKSGIDAATARDLVQQRHWRADVESNPVAFIERLAESARQNPSIAPQLRSVAARILGQRVSGQPQGQPDAADPEPQPDYQDASGTPFMSVPRQREWFDWHSRQLKAQMQAEYAPLIDERNQRVEADKKHQAIQEQYAATLQDIEAEVNELKQWPMFNESLEKVKALIRAKEFRIRPMAAYLHVLHTDILPNLSQTERTKTVAELRTQATSSSVNPKGAATSTPGTANSFLDPSLKWS
jgi:hypothetical protein